MISEEILAICILVTTVLFVMPLVLADANRPFWKEYFRTFLGLLFVYAGIGAVGGLVSAIFWAVKVLGASQ